MYKGKLKWLTPLLAALTFLLDGGHLVHLIGPEWLVLIAAAATTVSALYMAKGGTEGEVPKPQAKGA